MGTTKNWSILMRDEDYISLPSEFRQRFISEKVVFDDYEVYKNNPTFKKLYKEKRRATKKLDDWKFDQRHKL